MGKVKVKIHNKDYILDSGDRDEEYIKELALYVDEKMNEAANTSDNLNTTQISVLACLSIADEYFSFKNRKVSSGRDAEKFFSRMKVLLSKALKE